MNLKVAIIGFGLSGRYFHAPFLKITDGFELSKVMTSKEMSVKDYDTSISVVQDANAIFGDDNIDVVFICSPNNTHFEYAKKALESGKHVVIEKPFANTVAEAEVLISLSKSKNLVLTAYQNRRWDADFLTIQKILQSNLLGEIVEYEAHFDRFRPDVLINSWKETPNVGAGNFYNLGPHLIDQALTLFGPPNDVTATIKTLRPHSPTDDYFDVRLDYSDKRVILKSNLLAYQNQQRYAIFGTKGSFLKSGIDIQEETLRKNVIPNTDNWGQEPKGQWGTLYSEALSGQFKSEAGNYKAFYMNLYQAIVNKSELFVKPQQALNTTKVVELAFESNRLKRTIEF